jgi:choline kinase
MPTADHRPSPGDTRTPRVQVVVLAAGMGSRLGRSLPKPLTPLRDGRSILQHQLDALRAAFGPGVGITLVVGYRADVLRDAAPGVDFVHNPDYARTNTSKSLWRALVASRPGGVLWLNGDVVFDPAVLDQLVPAVHAEQSFVCVDTAAVGDEEVKYTVDTAGLVRELSKTVVGGLGEAVGINFVCAAEKQVLVEHLAACDDHDYFERGIETAIARRRMRVRPVDISEFAAVEVDVEEDLRRANDRCVPAGQAHRPTRGTSPARTAAPAVGS